MHTITTIHAPCIITPRLLAGVKVGDAFISIEYSPNDDIFSQYTYYRYYIDLPKYSYTNNDLRSGMGGGKLQEGLSNLLGFLCAFSLAIEYEQRTGYKSENQSLFPKQLVDWASQNSEELGMLKIELSETPNIILE